MIRLVDLSVLPSGRFCARLAALAGEEVVRFMPRPGPSAPSAPSGLFPAGRAGRPLRPADIQDAYLADGVTVVNVDWDVGSNRSRVEEAVRRADVVVSTFTAGQYHSPLNHDQVLSLNPAVVHVVLSPFGTEGPYREYPTSSVVDWAAGGYLHITGEPGRPPLAGPPDFCAYAAGYEGALAMEAGLSVVAATGQGLLLDVSHMETMLGLHQGTFARVLGDDPPVRVGNDLGPRTYPHGCYPTKDGLLFLGIVTDEEWDRLLIAIDRPELCADARLADGRGRKANQALTDEVVKAWTTGQSGEEAAAFLQSRRIPATLLATPEDILRDPQLRHRRYLRRVPLDAERAMHVPGNPLAIREAGAPPSGAPPTGALPRGASHRASDRTGPLPLSGVTVLDLTIWWAGPLCTRMLGDLGAEVLRVERPTSGDDLHAPSWHQFVHEEMNRNKRSLAVDLASLKGLQIVERLVAQADVVVQNYRPGVLARLGLGWDAAKAINPGLVYVSLSGYGSDGPKARWGTYGTLMEAASSVRHLTHYPDGEATRLGHPLPDAICGLAGAAAVLRGLRHVRETGSGVSYDVTQLETYTALIGDAIGTASLGTQGEIVEPGAWPTSEVVACAGEDQWVALTVPDEQVARQVAPLVGLGGSAPDAPDRETLGAAIKRFAATRPKGGVAEALRSRGVIALAVPTPRDLVSDPQLAARRYLAPVTLGDLKGWLPQSPIQSPMTELTRIERRAPCEGQHTREILGEKLGLSQAEIDELIVARVVKQAAPG